MGTIYDYADGETPQDGDYQTAEQDSDCEEKQYRDEALLSHLYEELGYSMADMAEELDCSVSTISYWMEKFGIERRGHGGTDSDEYTSLTHVGSYRAWVDAHDDEPEIAYVHQLLACMNTNPYLVFMDGTHVHHKLPEAPAIDVEKNVEVLPIAEHHRRHRDGKLTDSLEDVIEGDSGD